MTIRPHVIWAAGVLALLTDRSTLTGQSLVRPPSAAPAPGISVGRSVLRPRTTPITRLDDLARAATGNVSPAAYARFKTFTAYWRAAEPSWTGKAFEALLAFEENERLRLL